MEFGTKQYPYRYFKYVSSEILNQFSHKDVEITIYLKEGTDVYIREGDTFFINITKVSVASYSDGVNPPDYVRIVPTSIVQPSNSKRAAFIGGIFHCDVKFALKIMTANIISYFFTRINFKS